MYDTFLGVAVAGAFVVNAMAHVQAAKVERRHTDKLDRVLTKTDRAMAVLTVWAERWGDPAAEVKQALLQALHAPPKDS